MDGKKSSITSGSEYMSANEIEMTSMKESSSDLQKSTLKPSESKHETINEDILDETINEAAKEESTTEDKDKEEKDDEVDEETPLFNKTEDIPISPSTELRNEEIETTFSVPDYYEPEGEPGEENELLESVRGSRQIEQLEIEESQSPRDLILERLMSVFKDYMVFVIVGALLVVFFLFAIMVLPKCFFSLYYDEYALSRSTFTGKVDDTLVYEPGWYIMSPFNEWIKFKKSIHSIKMNNLRVFTTDQLMVQINIAVYYFLDKEKIGKLYRMLGSDYEKTIFHVSKSELLNAAQEFSISDFRSHRTHVKNYLKTKLKRKLKDDYGIDMFEIYLEKISFDKLINNINLKNVMNQILNEKAEHEKATALVYKNTQVQVIKLKNLAREINSMAIQNGTYGIINPEKANFDKIIELQHIAGLKNNTDGLGFTDQKKKISFCWMNSLVYNDKIIFFDSESTNPNAESELTPYNNGLSLSIGI